MIAGWSIARKFVVALFVVFLHYVPQITLFMDPEERYCGWWGRADLARIFGGAFLLAVVAMTLDALVRRSGSFWLKRIFNHVFLALLVSGLLAAFPAFTENHPHVVLALWIVALVAIAGSLVWRRSPLVRGAVVFCLIFSPLIPLLFVQMLTWHSWSPPSEPGAVHANREWGPSVFLFVFDEWSWLRSTRDGEFLPMFQNTRALCEQATLYRRAISPDRNTMQSLPRFIFQTDKTFVVGNRETWFRDGDREVPTREFPSLFLSARKHGYASYLLGWYHPYRHVLGSQVDFCRTYFSGDEAGPAERMAVEFLENSRNWSDPATRKLGPAVLDRLEARNWYRMGVRYREDTLRVLARGGAARRVVLCHVPTPHAPYVFNSDGSYHGPDQGLSDTAGYMRQLGYVDTLVGQIVQTLGAGRFHDALIVLTSDHGWRFDPDPAFRQGPDWDRRIPLIVKYPGQRRSQVVDKPTCSNQLQEILEEAFGRAFLRHPDPPLDESPW